jgi:hypothetical protein
MQARTFLRALSTLAALASGGTAVGCSSPGSEISATAVEADTRMATVQTALAAPTSEVSSATAKPLLSHWRSYQRVLPAFEALLAIGTDGAQSCLAGSAQAGTYDLGCLTHLQVMGQVTFETLSGTADGSSGRVQAQLVNACVGNACVNGDAVVDIAPSTDASLATLAVTATVAWEGSLDGFSFGVQGDVGGQLASRVVYIDANDQSLMVDGAGTLTSPGPYMVSGAAHTFACLFHTDSGQCSGSTTFTF